MEELIFLAFAAPQPPYSPDLAPIDFAFFPYLKSKLRGQRFLDLNDLRYATKDIIQKLA